MDKGEQIHAAQYIRMSTEGQDLSPAIQRAAILEYLQSHGMELVATYEDRGISGLTVRHRHAMTRLLKDVAQADCPFTSLLVYDVSRWGRFQDTDASAYYEYHCRLHGVDVIYVKEPFESNQTPLGGLLKHMKRAMAAEYSRELSVKTRAGQSKVIELGFHMGKLPPLAYQRTVVSKDGQYKNTLKRMERKPMQSDRVKWTLASPSEIDLAEYIFGLYAHEGLTLKALAARLAQEGLRNPDGRPFADHQLGDLLRNEAYVGDFAWGRRDQVTGVMRADGDPRISRAKGTVPAIVDRLTWERAQWRRQRARGHRRSKARLLSDLKAAVDADPALSGKDLRAHGCATEGVYRKFFGSFKEAFRLAGGDAQVAKAASQARLARGKRVASRFTEDLRNVLQLADVKCDGMRRYRGLILQGQRRMAIQLIWQRHAPGGLQWYLNKSPERKDFDFVLVVRMRENETAVDFLFLTGAGYLAHPPWFGDEIPIKEIHVFTASELVARIRTA